MSCEGLCKLACVLGTLISALAALAYAKREWNDSDNLRGQTKLRSQLMAGVVMVAAITTLWCSLKWVLMRSNKQLL